MTNCQKETFKEYRRRTSGPKWAIRVEFALLHSPAFLSLNYAPAIKVLLWFFTKRVVTVDKRRRGVKRFKVQATEISFTYEEGKDRGLDHKKFARALRELHGRGFLDIAHLGSGLRKDFSRYVLSDRWRAYGTENFKHVEFPKNTCYVAREDGRWIGRPGRKSQRPTSAVGQRPKSAVEKPPQRSFSAVEKVDLPESSTANFGRILRSTIGCRSLTGVEERGLIDLEVDGQEVDRGARHVTLPVVQNLAAAVSDWT